MINMHINIIFYIKYIIFEKFYYKIIVMISINE